MLYPGEASEPKPHLLRDRTFQHVDGIMVTTSGLTHVANSRPIGPSIQITMSGGQVVFGDIQNIDVAVLLQAAEAKLDELDITDEAREDARGVIRRMSEAAVNVGSAAAGSVAAAAIRHALGLP